MASPVPRPLTATEAELLRRASPEVKRVLLHLTVTRLVDGDGPPLTALWSLHRWGNISHRPRVGHRVAVHTPRSDGTVRTWYRSERDDCGALLGLLYPYGVRWKEDEPGTIHLIGAAYQWLRPIAVHQLVSEGRWPPPHRYRRHRSLRKVPVA